MITYNELTKNLPQLIVSLDEDGNYIHIRDAKDNVEYRCPCCNEIVKPRAYKENKDYQVQPHFYHIKGSCDEESRVHWLYKNWLFKKGSKFYINNILYDVDFVEIEKTYNTKFGVYRPDITVNLSNGQVVFFEINFTNEKQNSDYFCKWNELNNDVIEVDIRKLMNEDYKCEIPEFNLIYSNGVCYKDKYKEKDEYYIYIHNRKLIWRRQDKIDYKIQWEKLDWFWIELQKYKAEKSNTENVLECFSHMEFEDMDFCMTVFKKMKINELFELCIPIINSRFLEIISDFDISPYKYVDFAQESPRIFYVGFEKERLKENIHYYCSFVENRSVKYYDLLLLNNFKTFIESDYFKGIEVPYSHLEDIVSKIEKDDVKEYRLNVYYGKREYVSLYDLKFNHVIYSYNYSSSYSSFSYNGSLQYLFNKGFEKIAIQKKCNQRLF